MHVLKQHVVNYNLCSQLDFFPPLLKKQDKSRQENMPLVDLSQYDGLHYSQPQSCTWTSDGPMQPPHVPGEGFPQSAALAPLDQAYAPGEAIVQTWMVARQPVECPVHTDCIFHTSQHDSNTHDKKIPSYISYSYFARS